MVGFISERAVAVFDRRNADVAEIKLDLRENFFL
jgi:hypothetical protein